MGVVNHCPYGKLSPMEVGGGGGGGGGRRTRVLQTGNPKRRHLCVCVEEVLGDGGS